MLDKTIINTGRKLINSGKQLISLISKKIDQKEGNTKSNEVELIQNIDISTSQFKILKNLIKSVKTRTDVKERAKLVVKCYFDDNVRRCSKELNTSRNRVRKWKNRWIANQNLLKRTELEEPHNLKNTVVKVLSDNYRIGRPPVIRSEQVATIIYLSLQYPSLFGLPISHWTAEKLREVAIKLEIIEDISTRQINRYLKQSDINLYKYQGWLNSMESNPDIKEYSERVEKICKIYINSDEYTKDGAVILSTDEKTGIQAREHKHPVKPVRQNSLMKIEQEYERNGTTMLIATRDITSGKVIPMLNPTRKEKDFLKHIKDVLKNFNDKKEIIFVMDQLNTHMSESLVKLVAQECNITDELGKKGKSGILKSMKTRAKFLEDTSHRIRIVYTPKHCSWLNQIELWFGIITRQLLNKRSSFKSVEELNRRILEYIKYYNENLAKKFKWNYDGKILQV